MSLLRSFTETHNILMMINHKIMDGYQFADKGIDITRVAFKAYDEVEENELVADANGLTPLGL